METLRLMGCTITTVASCECHHNADVCIFSSHVKLLYSFTRHYINLILTLSTRSANILAYWLYTRSVMRQYIGAGVFTRVSSEAK